MNMSSRFIFANAFITLYIICSLIVISCSNVHSANDIKFNLGKEASNKIISNLDISINVKGSNLPIGSGTALDGEKIFNTKCISCHHDKDIGRQEQMFIPYNLENTSIPISTDWSFSFTLFDYIRKTMPYNSPQTLTNEETYSLTAYLLYKMDIIQAEYKIDQYSLPKVLMPKKNHYINNWIKQKDFLTKTSYKKDNSFFFKIRNYFSSSPKLSTWSKANLNQTQNIEKINIQDISIDPYGENLPLGSGTAEIGEKIYQSKCLSCHGIEGEAQVLSREIESLRGGTNMAKRIVFPSLSGGLGTLNTEIPVRTVGSLWPYSTTLFDYIRRAMPYYNPQSLTNDEVYAVTAYVLYINKIVNKNELLDSQTLAKIKMPNRGGFLDQWGPEWWREWLNKKFEIFFTAILLLSVTLIILFSKKMTQYRKTMNFIKTAIIGITFIWIGLLNKLQIGTQKVHESASLLLSKNWAWDELLSQPVFFILAIFTLLSTILLGRGVFCGWLCPFGIIQDALHKLAQFINLKRYELTYKVHSKLIFLKYIILIGLLISTVFVTGTNIFMEFEPFKTIIDYRFNRSIIFILWAITLLIFVTFIQRGFCRYLCPTGAALSLLGHFQTLNWLKTVKTCGKENCKACMPKCPTRAIKLDGSIRTLECIQCQDCQVTYQDKNIKCKNQKRKASIRDAFILEKTT